MKYVISGGDEDGKTFPIDMLPCDEDQYKDFKQHYVESRAKQIQAHIDEKQFFCGDLKAKDLTMYGSPTSSESKLVTVALLPCDETAFSAEEREAGMSC